MKDIVKQKINNRAQALVEFVLILPIILMIIFVIIDFSNIFYYKNHLEGVLNDVVDVITSDKDELYIKKIIGSDIEYKLNYEDGYVEVTLEEKVDLWTPFADIFFDNPYKISTKRVVLDE